jgi:hypothetical protein
MSFRRLQIAYDRTQDFFGIRALVIGLIPVVYWILDYYAFDHNPMTEHLVILGATYAAVGSAVFLIQFMKAGTIVASEGEKQQMLDALTQDEQKELKRLVLRRKVRVGQNAFDQIAGKTTFIFRAGDAWRIEEEHREFLERWAKRYRTTEGVADPSGHS